jgi:glyoxylase-like metal-dependent hydrolase (beta-lactamase superfamily II)
VSVIHCFRLRVSNAYLVVGDRPILVDTGSRGDAARIEAGCAAAGVRMADLALILHTHVHSDHFGNTAHFAARIGCPVAYHEADAGLVAQGHNGRIRGVGLRGRLLAPLVSGVPFERAAADISPCEGMRLDEFGVAGAILHTPGHTAGSVSVMLDSGDAIIGDVIMGGYAGGAIWPSRPNFHYFADDLPGAMASLDRILTATSGRLFVGHGGPLHHQAVKKWRRRHDGRR